MIMIGPNLQISSNYRMKEDMQNVFFSQTKQIFIRWIIYVGT